MGLIKRKASNPERERAAALAQRGVAGIATIVAMRETGAERGSELREVELTLALELPSTGRLHVVHQQFVGRFTGYGLAPGEPVSVLYDRANPQTLAIRGHAQLRTEVRDGEIVPCQLRELHPAPGG
jgi:hypothetical protein